MKKITFYAFMIVLSMLTFSCTNNQQSGYSSPSNMYSYEGDVTVYRQELLTSSERNPATGKYDVEWHYVKDATCPLYSDNTGTSYIKYKGEYCQVFNINQEMFPDEWSNGFTKAVDTKGKYNLVLR